MSFASPASGALVALIIFCLAPVEVLAQDRVTSPLLISKSARQAAQRSLPQNQSRQQRLSNRSSRGSTSAAEAFELDTVDDYIWKGRQYSDFYDRMQGLSYLRYLRAVIDVDEFDTLEETSFTERLFFYHLFKTAVGLVEGSPIEETYRQIGHSFKRLKKHTSVQVVRSGEGDYDFHRGEKHEEHLLQLKVHASARDGVEPRLSISEHLRLRYNPLEGETILEYGFDF